MFSLLAAAALSSLQPQAALATPVSPATALRALTGCTKFKWVALPGVSDRAAITVPVRIGAETYNFQLDTGSNASMVYKIPAAKFGVGEKQGYFRPGSVSLGGKQLSSPSLLVNRRMEGTDIAGTIGLDLLLGRIVILDYPERRFCLLDDPDVPGAIVKADWVNGTLRSGKFFVPVSIGDFATEDMFFDTGASLTPVSVDLKTWRELTKLPSTANAPEKITGPAWGNNVTLIGAKAHGPMRIGKTVLASPMIFTREGKGERFANYPFRAAGLIGNAAIWDQIAIFDLTTRMNFGLVRD